MPYKEKIIEKKYYTIGEVAKMLNVGTSLIRFWETKFDNIKPQKSRNGERRFVKEDIKNIKLVYHLVKERGYTLQGAQDYLIKNKTNHKKIDKNMKLVSSLKEMKQFLIEIKNNLSADDE